jgi:hypothetical protein
MSERADLPGPFCAFCGEIMGVYEPLILIGHDRSTVRTSRLSHRGTPDDVLMVHEDCYKRRQPWSDDGLS